MLLAGIDIGTLTCRLLIADVTGNFSLTEIESDRQILRLGEGVAQKRYLSTAAMSRVGKTMILWRARMQRYPLAGSVVVATSAVREASNREEFLAYVRREVGFKIEVLSGEEEAQRTLLGIQSGLPAKVGSFLGIDIGGGSTEFMRVHKPQLTAPPQLFSLDVGVVSLTERVFHSGDPPSEQAVFAAEGIIRTELERIRLALGDLTDVTCVGTAGTITTLAAMAQKLSSYEPARIHNYQLDFGTIQQLERELRMQTRSARRELPGLEQGREDVIIAGTVILREVMQILGFRRCLVSNYGLREGILVEKAARIRSSNSQV